MKNNILIIVLVIVVIAVGVIFLSIKNKSATTTNQGQSQQNADSIVSGGKMLTAKKAYDIAINEAKKYAADGYLVDI